MQKQCIFLLLAAATLFLIPGCGDTEAEYEMAEKAIEQNNPALCNTLLDVNDQTECLEIVALNMSDPRICLLGNESGDCVEEYAVKKDQMSSCDILTDPAKKYKCIAYYTGDKTGRALDQIISDWRLKGSTKQCKAACEKEAEPCFAACVTNNPDPTLYRKSVLIPDRELCEGDCRDGRAACQKNCDEIANPTQD